MAFKDEDIMDSYLEELIEKENEINRWGKDRDYPHDNYDYSTDDPNNFDYQQDMYE